MELVCNAITMVALLQMAGILAVDLMILHYQCMVHVPSSKWETFCRELWVVSIFMLTGSITDQRNSEDSQN
ncbi:hypothetical protein DKX38_026684 [Salix brachista]|uniref:Uncharacterized protein n=1 Tax=Salix brachista TaxID=2182728 RepID=A0A5N5JC15_9ROSI|nr:hypothetical protein DKX38_026684 [Salix brachista]